MRAAPKERLLPLEMTFKASFGAALRLRSGGRILTGRRCLRLDRHALRGMATVGHGRSRTNRQDAESNRDSAQNFRHRTISFRVFCDDQSRKSILSRQIARL